MITKELVRGVVPKNIRSNITDDYIDLINNCIDNFEYGEAYEDNFFTHVSVLGQGRFKLTHYSDAIKYVTCKLFGMTNEQAYMATFPQKCSDLIASGKTVASYAQQYDNGKLVNLIFERTLVPTHVVNAPLHQKAINLLADGIINKNEYKGMAKVKAIETLLKYTAEPINNVTNNSLNINVENNYTESILTTITSSIGELADAQMRELKSNNISIKEIAESVIGKIEEDVIDGEFEYVEED